MDWQQKLVTIRFIFGQFSFYINSTEFRICKFMTMIGLVLNKLTNKIHFILLNKNNKIKTNQAINIYYYLTNDKYAWLNKIRQCHAAYLEINNNQRTTLTHSLSQIKITNNQMILRHNINCVYNLILVLII